jgi:hypothetical protein
MNYESSGVPGIMCDMLGSKKKNLVKPKGVKNAYGQ